MVESIHNCSYYCHRPECIRRQRDELRDNFINVLYGRECYLQLGAVLATASSFANNKILTAKLDSNGNWIACRKDQTLHVGYAESEMDAIADLLSQEFASTQSLAGEL